MPSITWRITGLMFLSVLLTVLVLVYLANYQMTAHFRDYLAVQQPGMGHHGQAAMAAAGTPERVFLESIHRSLYWVGAVILVAGLAVSYLLAQSITVPIRKLSAAAAAIAKGHYGRQVTVPSGDEVGRLTAVFNLMSRSLADADASRRRFLADVAHELRTPLAIIQGNLEGMAEAAHLNRLITDLRDLSLAEGGQLVLEKEATDVNMLVLRAVSMLEPLAQEKGVTLVSEPGSVPVSVLDPRLINQVLYNLLTNSLRHTPSGGRVTVTTGAAVRQGRNWLRIAVADTGCGIDAADLPFVFDRFYRADRSRDRRSGGSGLGLAIVRELTEIHGGRVTAASEPGRGSTFTVFLPVKPK
jgi:two-component system sensor histidine kinase BaeS